LIVLSTEATGADRIIVPRRPVTLRNTCSRLLPPSDALLCETTIVPPPGQGRFRGPLPADRRAADVASACG
jgi:hypothetical protein